MNTVTLEITNDNALRVLQELQEKHFINIIAEPDLKATVFPGKPLTTKEFNDFIEARENGKNISLQEAKGQWQKKKTQLQKIDK